MFCVVSWLTHLLGRESYPEPDAFSTAPAVARRLETWSRGDRVPETAHPKSGTDRLPERALVPFECARGARRAEELAASMASRSAAATAARAAQALRPAETGDYGRNRSSELHE